MAGGQARRMGGGDKGRLPLAAGYSLMQSVIDRLGPQCDALVLSANGPPARFADMGLPVLGDDIGAGPLAGVLAGLDYAAVHGFSQVLSVAADTPFFPRDLAQRLGAAPAIATSGGAAHPVFGLWPVGVAQDLRAALGAGRLRMIGFADQVGARRVDFAVDPFDPFFNINTPADLAVAQQAFSAGCAL
ncbi:molybdenum cofactor guanylyltransferase MobA [Ketogulonicigenium robustum]|uniref:molybdenum cofactor guanylyltransferase MobA n=1 Tax=Ketogulonicigenium robustum TaxID=92947 RepID=UPI0021501DF2|nr:molybdenum cofactor guanylyltransferase MobA [Ketogulonicigenium robustum]